MIKFKQMATTAAGVAVGSAVVSINFVLFKSIFFIIHKIQFQGHAVSDTVGSAFRSKSESSVAEVDDPCSIETNQFLNCARTQSNLTNCEKLSEAFKHCTEKMQKP